MTGQSGFTLIEALVAGIISVIIPGVVITLLHVNNTELASNTALLRLTQIAGVVSEDIRGAAYRATYVYSTDDAGPGGCPAGDPTDAYTNLDGVVFCDAAKAAIKGYRVVPVSGEIGRLEEFTGAGGAWQSFTVGPDIVQVDLDPGPYSQKTGGLFGLYNHAEFLWFNMRYRMTLGGAQTILPLQTESVKCRNAPSRNW